MQLKCFDCGNEQFDEDLILINQEHLCYMCGNHLRNLDMNKCYNMDCQEGLKLLRTESVDLIVTDPPYDVDILDKQESLIYVRKLNPLLMESYQNYQEFNCDYNLLAKQFYRVLKDNTHCYIFAGHLQISKWVNVMENVGFKFCQILNWNTWITKYDLTRGHKYPENKEEILFFQKGWRKLEYKRNPKELFRTSFYFNSRKNKNNKWHLCPRPYELLKMLILNSSNENDLLLDCFAGSGEHLISAMKLQRNFIGFEISKVFCDKIQERINFQKQQKKLFEVV